MSEDPGFKDSPLRPFALAQNPAPFPESGQDFISKVRTQTEAILAQFAKVLPSNYVSQVTGPFYTLQFQAAAEQIATLQVKADEVFADSDYDFTRPEFLWEILGALVFPEASGRNDTPIVDGVVAYRTFLKQMVLLLLRGATKSSVQTGAGLLTEAEVTVIERFLGAREPGSEWTIDDQFTFDVLVETNGGTAFPTNPFTLEGNVALILDALKPAHTLYTYSFLFREVFGPLFDDTNMSWELSEYFYDDLRKFCYGAKEITGTAGVTLAGRTTFSDATRSFGSVQVNGRLVITSGPNAGPYRIREILAFPFPTDATARTYTTAPSGLFGSATVAGDVLTDLTQDFALAVEGEVLTFTAGPNVGSYRLEFLQGLGGGPVGFAPGPATAVRVAASILRVDTRMPVVASAQSYTVDVDRLGERQPKVISGEDVSVQFYL